MMCSSFMEGTGECSRPTLSAHDAIGHGVVATSSVHNQRSLAAHQLVVKRVVISRDDDAILRGERLRVARHRSHGKARKLVWRVNRRYVRVRIQDYAAFFAK